MKNFSFDLSNPPLFYVSGFLEVTESWTHKPMYQKGNYEIIFVVAGSLFLEIGEQQYVVHQSEYFIVPPYKEMFGYQTSPIGTKFIWIHFFPKEFLTGNDSYYKVTIPQYASMFHFDHLLILAHQVLDQSEANNSLVTDYSVGELLSFMSTDYLELQKSIKKTSAKSAIIKNWIDAHLGEIQSNDTVAEAFHFNKVYLNRLFKENYHISIYQYLIRTKIERAKSLLVSTDNTIAEIARKSFFSDDKSFSKTFKNKTGMTPTTYKRTFTRQFINTPSADPEIKIPNHISERLKKQN